MKPLAALFCTVLAAATVHRQVHIAASCEGLSLLALPNTTITSAQTVPAGGAGPAAGMPALQQANTLPAFCRIAATLKPSSDSDIKIEVWLPVSGWNRKFQAVGNGGWAGSIAYSALGTALRRGYAASSTDTGHNGGSASFALGHPEKLVDYAYRSEHEMTLKAKAILTTYYGDAPTRSYWNGCSAGGKQGLMEAQRFPEDFDGIVAGAPAINWTGRAAQALWVNHAVHRDESSYIPPAKYPAIHSAVLTACDAHDGVRDGVLEDPTRCTFDPKVLQCQGADGPTCLTSSQVEAARKIYAPAINPRTREVIFPGHEPGSELGWATMAGPRPFGIALDLFKYVVFQDPNWNERGFDFDGDYALTEKLAGEINALDPDLKPFFGHGGKLLQYHGWSDPQISPGSSVNYFKSVLAASGGVRNLSAAYRLFMVPGMAHCGGGEGPNSFDVMTALEQWVEQGKAPDQMIASRLRDGKVDRTRPLCPYPEVARYTGTGSTDDAANFICKAQ
jgi:feruloyl esterase